MNIVGGITGLRENRVDGESTRAALKDELVFRFQGVRIVGAECNAVVDNCSLLLVPQKRVQSQRLGRIVFLLESKGHVAQMHVNPSACLYTTNKRVIFNLLLRPLVVRHLK